MRPYLDHDVACEHPAPGPVRKWKTAFRFPRRASAVFGTGQSGCESAQSISRSSLSADHTNSRATLDMSDLRIGCVGTQHPSMVVSSTTLNSLRGVSISLRYPQWVVVSGPVCRCGPDDRLVSCWLHGDSLLDKTVEQLSPAVRLAPVEPEGKLVQIAIQMLDAHRSLMCAQ